MKASILINNYNYNKYLDECISSVLNQTYKDFELIIVDDGSTDDSVKTLKIYENNPKIKIIYKKNNGQLSSFNEAYKHITGEIIFFLDSDDLYYDNYISDAILFYKTKPDCDFLFVRKEYFGDLIFSEKVPDCDINYGFSILKTFFMRRFIGSSTSTLSLRIDILKKILPLDLEDDWKIRADDCLVFGASLIGAQKFFLCKTLVKYRVHSSNNYFNKKYSPKYYFQRNIKILTLFEEIVKKNRMVIDSSIFYLEYRSIPKKTIRDFKDYFKINLLLKGSIYKRFRRFLILLIYLFKK